MMTERTTIPGAAPVKRASETAPVEETDVAVQVTRDIMIDHGFAGSRTNYRAGQIVPAGREARELLKRRPTAVARVDHPFVVCPGWTCHSPILMEHVRASGQLIVEDAAEVVYPVHFMLDIILVDLKAGDLLELILDPTRAREVRGGLASGALRSSGRSVFRVRCRTCQSNVLVAVPKV